MKTHKNDNAEKNLLMPNGLIGTTTVPVVPGAKAVYYDLNKEETAVSDAAEAIEEIVDNDMMLTPHFRLAEFTRSATAIRHDINNTPTMVEVKRLKALCENVLEPLRKRFGVIRITSGYRSYRVNEKVGGARNSQHLYGEAADIHCGSTLMGKKFYDFIRENCEFDQMLVEFSNARQMQIHCLHVSFKSDRGKNRRKAVSYYPVK